MTRRSVELYETFLRLRSKTTGQWFVSQRLRPKLVARALEQDTNLNEVVVSLLLERYNVGCLAGSTKTTRPARYATEIKVWLPAPLYRAINAAAARRTPPVNMQTEILTALSEEFSLPMPARVRTRSTRTAARR